jgi:hypothetical protein
MAEPTTKARSSCCWTQRGSCGGWKLGAEPPSAGRDRAAVDGAAGNGCTLGETGQPMASPELADADGASWRRMVDDLEADAVAAGHAHLDGRAWGVPVRVGQAFLQDAVGSPGSMPGYRADVTGDVEVELNAGLRCARQEILGVLQCEGVFLGRGHQEGQPTDVQGGFAGQLGDGGEQAMGPYGASGQPQAEGRRPT